MCPRRTLNSDQGSQFTSEVFTEVLKSHDIRISMDGRGAWRGDAAEIERVLADDYLLTDESGKLFTKADDLGTYKIRQTKTGSVKTLDHKVCVVGDIVVIANATINFKGTKNGKPFDITEQCPNIWAWRDGRWQIVSDHISFVKQ